MTANKEPKPMKQEIYISVDIETNGPIPGPYSMLSLGAVAFDAEGNELGSFPRNFHTLVNAGEHPETMEFWNKNPQAYEETRKNLVYPADGMQDFNKWVKKFNGIPVFTAYPAGFDFTWVYWYLIAFCQESPFSFSALDIKSYVAGLTGKPYRQCTKKNMPKRWFPAAKHSHIAIEDAREQGLLFINILKEARCQSL